jgi:hypothetical protein
MDEAREGAKSLTAALEEGLPISQVLMKAQKVARLLRDTDAQTWLQYETNGYPQSAEGISLGHCGKYAMRFYGNGTMYTPSLPELEARAKAAEAELMKMQPVGLSAPVENPIVAAATERVMKSIATQNTWLREGFVQASANYQKLRNAIYRYAVDTLIAIELGDVAASVFEEARIRVDRFVSEKVPKGAEQLVAANDRLREDSAEARAAALMACRRFLVSVADAVFPPRVEPHVDGRGKTRKVGPEEYKNRLLAFVESGLAGSTTLGLVSAQLEHLVARLDALNDLVCKGVHANVTDEEARLATIETYIFVSEVARVPVDPNAARIAAANPQPPAAESEPAPSPNPQHDIDS